MDIRAHNRQSWDKEVERENEWTVPVTSEKIALTREGQWEIFLTPKKPVPADWWPQIRGARVLCLASGGGQQGPILAAAGAKVTIYDNSPRQLAQDRRVAERERLELTTVEGDMADLGQLADSSFDLIVNPVSTVFSEKVLPVWRECFRVLKEGGVLLAGFMNPAVFLFDEELIEKTGELKVVNKIPYSDADGLPPDRLKREIEEKVPLEYSHSLTELIGGQIGAGFILTGMFVDTMRENHNDLISRHMPVCIATRALKPKGR